MPNYPDSIQDLEPLSGLYIRKRFLNINNRLAQSPTVVVN